MTALLVDRSWAAQMSEVLKPAHFELKYLEFLSARYLAYTEKYKDYPSLKLLVSIVRDELKMGNDLQLRDQIVDFIKEVNANSFAGDLPHVKEKSLDFCKKQNLKRALEKTVDDIAMENYDSIVETIKKALSAGTAADTGHDFFEDTEARFQSIVRNVIPTGFPELDAKDIFQGGIGQGELGVIVANTGCHAKGTDILMYDGSIKKVEDVVLGDVLMGPDSRPRNVLKLVRGNEKMYEITPKRYGRPFVVNENHMLSLKTTRQTKSEERKIVNISVKDYLKTDSYYKHLHKLRKSELIEFKNDYTLRIPPYVLGILLGDGCLRRQCIEFTTAEPDELLPELREFVGTFGLQLKEHRKENNKAAGYRIVGEKGTNSNDFVRLLREMNLIDKLSGDKYVPNEYKTASVHDRLEILAGLLDTDGYYRNNCYEFCSKSKQLADDVEFISRSLGLSVSMVSKYIKCIPYYRLMISGDVSVIPVRLKRKRGTPRRQKRDHLVTGFDVRELPNDDFYGFTLDGDHLYLTGDFVVHHNCGKSHCLTALGANAIRSGFNVIYYTFELSAPKIGIRFDSNFCDIDSNDIVENKDKVLQFYEGNSNFGKLIIKSYPANTATIGTLRAHIEKLSIKDFRPDLIIIDYADIMRSSRQYDSPRHELKLLYEELRSLADELHVPIWTASQSNREGANSEIVDVTNMSESYGKAATADIVVSISRRAHEKASGLARFFIAKNRAGRDGLVFPIKMNTARSQFNFLGNAVTPGEAQAENETDAKQRLRNKFAQYEDIGLKKLA